MKKFLICIALSSLMFTACKDEDVLEPQIIIELSASKVSEYLNSEYIRVDFKLSQPAPEDLFVDFSFSGNAIYGKDYIASTSDPLKIVKGESRVGMVIYLNDDDEHEDLESISLSINHISSFVNVTSPIESLIEIEDNDPESFKIELTWPTSNGEPHQADMHLILWSTEAVYPIAYSAFEGLIYETVNLQYSVEDGLYGLTYLYYSGAANNLEYSVKFTNPQGTISTIDDDGVITERGNTFIIKGKYTLANLNTSNSVQIEHLFLKEGNNYLIEESIYIPTDGSRKLNREFAHPLTNEKGFHF